MLKDFGGVFRPFVYATVSVETRRQEARAETRLRVTGHLRLFLKTGFSRVITGQKNTRMQSLSLPIPAHV